MNFSFQLISKASIGERNTQGTTINYLVSLFNFSILGHEAIAEIVENKRPNSELKVGDRVTFSIANTCQGECANCKLQLPQKCKQLTKVGIYLHEFMSLIHPCNRQQCFQLFNGYHLSVVSHADVLVTSATFPFEVVSNSPKKEIDGI